MKKKLLLGAFFLMASIMTVCAQDTTVNLSSTLQGFYNNTLRPLFPIVIATVFLVSAMMNIGEIWGEHKNWKSFLSKVGLYTGICIILVVVVNFLFTLSI